MWTSTEKRIARTRKGKWPNLCQTSSQNLTGESDQREPEEKYLVTGSNPWQRSSSVTCPENHPAMHWIQRVPVS